MSKKCKYRHCDNKVTGQKQYCSDRCRSFENCFVREETKHLPPVRKRNASYFYMSTGSQPNSLRGHGGRSHRGAMAARVQIETQEIAPVTKENLERHFKANNGYRNNVKFCDETYLSKEEAIQKFALIL